MHNWCMRLRLLFHAILVVALSVLLVVVAVPLMMRYTVASHLYVRAHDAPKAQAAMILGASVVRGKPSPILEERAQRAVELYTEGRVSKILVTGDNGALTHDEVTPVRKYLIDAGIPAADIFLDHAGFDTYSSMYRARDVFGADSLVIVTQDFHLPRAVYIARKLGLDASGLAAQGGENTPENYAREIPASFKAVIDLAYGRKPKYLGEAIPLSGNGEDTWF